MRAVDCTLASTTTISGTTPEPTPCRSHRKPSAAIRQGGGAEPPFAGLIACELRELNEVAAGVVHHRDGRGRHVGGRHRELGAAPLDPLVVAFDVVGEEHGRGLALL